MDAKDCCCFLFKAKTGVMLIGSLLVLGVIADIAVSWIYTENFGFFYWYPIPNILILVLLLYKFKEAFESEGHYNDYEKRVEFFRVYLFVKTIVGQIWVMVSFKLATNQLANHCAKYEEDCNYLKDVYHWSFWINFAFTTITSAYFAFVCKLYAD